MNVQLRRSAEEGAHHHRGLTIVEGADPAHPCAKGASDQAPVQTIAIVGGKGGTGKSNVAVNLAAAMASTTRPILLLDGDLELGNVDQLLGMTARGTLAQVISGERSLQDIVHNGPNGLQVIPGASGVMEMARLSHTQYAYLIRSFSDLSTKADTMVVDLATGLSDCTVSFSRAAREVIVVLCNEPTAMQDAFSTIRVLHQNASIQRFRIVANKTESASHGLDLFAALTRLTDRHLDVLLDYCGSIPFDQHVKKAVCQQQAVVHAFPRSSASMAFLKLAARVDRWPRPMAPAGHIEFFVERLIQATDRTW